MVTNVTKLIGAKAGKTVEAPALVEFEAVMLTSKMSANPMSDELKQLSGVTSSQSCGSANSMSTH